ncbi:polysaccharide biosynthesis C-terminal domain-containing protein [Lactiplantibacillus plantarum]|uniref:oligosaccharide flippase family protein n=1 Tax=Lactiplantibacillus plantarum TaxID=1590 RepID=UPI0007AC0E33|nr:polysaccharide biosynthesis C-terminal domain-containing protein [Lactiplantibacillus plantarum]
MRFILNYIYNSSYQLFLILVPIVTLPYLARTLGPEYLGINSYTYSVTYYFTLLAVLGTTTYAQREVAYVRDNPEKLHRFFWEVELLSVITTLTSYIILAAVILFSDKYSLFFWAYSIVVIANIFDISWLFIGTEQFSILAVRNFVIKIFSVILIFTLVKSRYDLIDYILINSCSTLLSNLLLWPYIKQMNLFVGVKHLKPFRHLKGTLALFVPQISVTLYTVLNKVLLGYMGKIKAGSYFDNADKIVRLTFTLLTSLSTVLMPVIANEVAKKNTKNVNKILRQSMMFSLCMSIALFFGFLGLSDRLVPLFLGSDYGAVKYILKVQAFILIPMSIANVVGNQYLVPLKKSKQLNVSIISGSVINILISVPMILFWGAEGASYAVLISETLVTLVQLWLVRNSLSFKGILSEIVKYVVAAIVMSFMIQLIQRFIEGWPSIIASVVFGASIYFISLFMLHSQIMRMGKKLLKRVK